MQSTGHSSMHALSLRSTQGSAMVYVTGTPQVLSINVINGGCLCTGVGENSLQYPMRIRGGLPQPALTSCAHRRGARAVTDTRRCIYKCSSRYTPMRIDAVQQVAYEPPRF